MFRADQYKDKAAEYKHRAEIAVTSAEKQEYHDLHDHFRALAESTQWPYDNCSRTVRSLELPPARLHIENLDAEAVKCIIHACDGAWHALQGSIFAIAPRAAETREFLVQHIIEAAQSGERDPARLSKDALQAFGLCSAG